MTKLVGCAIGTLRIIYQSLLNLLFPGNSSKEISVGFGNCPKPELWSKWSLQRWVGSMMCPQLSPLRTGLPWTQALTCKVSSTFYSTAMEMGGMKI